MGVAVKSFFDPTTFTYSYVVSDPLSRQCVCIDPVLDFNPANGHLATDSAGEILEYINEQDLTVTYLLETHVHADHLSASHYLQKQVGGKIGIGEHVRDTQDIFAPIFNAGPEFRRDGSQFDELFADGASFKVGGLMFSVMHTPGHTPACVTYLVDRCAFVGDTLFMPDYGTARADFPGGDASVLYDSIQKILAQPDDTIVYLCHDYLAPGREAYQNKTTVAAEKGNVHLLGTRDEFVLARQAKDKTLAAPRLLLPSIQVNMRAGALPEPEPNDIRYLKIPIRGEAL